MFKGEYNHSIDDKGRIILPAKLREELGTKVVISRGIDPCLYIYTKDEWEKFEEKLAALSLLNPRSRMMQEYFSSGGVDCDLDKQGRIVIPPNHRKVFGDCKDMTLIGAGRRIEIWSEPAWKEHISRISDDLESLTEELAELGVIL